MDARAPIRGRVTRKTEPPGQGALPFGRGAETAPGGLWRVGTPELEVVVVLALTTGMRRGEIGVSGGPIST